MVGLSRARFPIPATPAKEKQTEESEKEDGNPGSQSSTERDRKALAILRGLCRTCAMARRRGA